MAAGRQALRRDQGRVVDPSSSAATEAQAITVGLGGTPSLLPPAGRLARSTTPAGSSSATDGEGRPAGGSSTSNRSANDDDDDSEPRPPRPPNAWMLYRSARFRAMESRQEEDAAYNALSSGPSRPRNKMAEVSRIISAMWRDEDPAVKEHYQRLADARKQEHLEMYPGYKYRPRKSRNSKARNVGDARSAKAPAPIDTKASPAATGYASGSSSAGPSSAGTNLFLPGQHGAGRTRSGGDDGGGSLQEQIGNWPATAPHDEADRRWIQSILDGMPDPSFLSHPPRSAGAVDDQWAHGAAFQPGWGDRDEARARPSPAMRWPPPSAGIGPFSAPASAPPSTARFMVHPGSWNGGAVLDPQLGHSNVGHAFVGLPAQQQHPLDLGWFHEQGGYGNHPPAEWMGGWGGHSGGDGVIRGPRQGEQQQLLQQPPSAPPQAGVLETVHLEPTRGRTISASTSTSSRQQAELMQLLDTHNGGQNHPAHSSRS